MIAGKAIDFDFRAGDTVCKIIKWISRVRLKRITDVGRLIETGSGQTYPLQVCCLYPIFPSAIRFVVHYWLQSAHNLFARILSNQFHQLGSVFICIQ